MVDKGLNRRSIVVGFVSFRFIFQPQCVNEQFCSELWWLGVNFQALDRLQSLRRRLEKPEVQHLLNLSLKLRLKKRRDDTQDGFLNIKVLIDARVCGSLNVA